LKIALDQLTKMMWPPTVRNLPNSLVTSPRVNSQLAVASGLAIALLAQTVQAQTPPAQPAPAPPAAPTARYAQGEDVDLAEIINEWRGYYSDIPVYLCVCQDDTCDLSERWPRREFDRYQLTVALGPSNGQFTQSLGFNCFDIADGSRPDNPRNFSSALVGADQPGAASPPDDDQPDDDSDNGQNEAPANPPAVPTPPSNNNIPTATTISNGEAIRIDWPSGASNVINVTGSDWNIDVLEALDCPTLSIVEKKTMSAQRVINSPMVDRRTGNVAVPVLLDSCVETDQSAVFILDPEESGSYSLYRTQLPGNLNIPNEFSSHAFSTITELRYWDGSLLVQQGSASGSESIVIFRRGSTPAGEYAGCAVVTVEEGADTLCPD
jgi:hypothetical protein